MLVALMLIADLAASVPAPRHVAVHARHSGWHDEESSLEIQRAPKGFSDGKRSIDESLLRALVAATTAPPATLDVTRFRVDLAALRRAAEKESAGLPRQTAARFVAGVCDPKNLTELATSVVHQEWTDDYPSVDVDLTLESGEHVLLASHAQSPFMLPWQIVRGDHSVRTYDPDLARAVAAVLPEKFVNRSRMSGAKLPEALARAARMQWRDEIERGVADEKYGAELAPLRARFHVTRENAGFVLGFNASDEVWTAHIEEPGSPRVGFTLWLSIQGGHLANVGPFVRDADALVRRVGSISWIARLLESHPATTLSIEYRDDRSLGAYAQKDILDGLRRDGKTSLLAIVAPLLDRSIGVYVQEGNKYAIWVVLPDGRAFITFSSPTAPGGMPVEHTGDLVRPDGSVVSPP